MKLSKTATIALTSASAIVYGFGVLAVQVSAQDANILTSEVSNQIQQALGEADGDELLVDALSQVESQLREYGVSSFSPSETDSNDITELKLLRRSYIQQLRERLSSLTADEKQAFLAKIRARRAEVRQELVAIRQEKRTELQQLRQERREATQADLEARREQFKANLEAKKEAVEKRNLPADVKFKSRLESKQQRLEAEENLSDAQKVAQQKREQVQRENVKGAIDYQPANILEQIGYWLAGF